MTSYSFSLHRNEDETGISGTGVVAMGFVFPDGVVALRWLVGDHRSTVIHESIEAVEDIHGHGGKTQIIRHVPTPDLSRLPEMSGYLEEHAHETGDDGPLELWREIRRSITEPARAWMKDVGGNQA